tara:strand:- start:234 stop:572 length:339 start_codon:yes stop_codon:yes gene_type:complete
VGFDVPHSPECQFADQPAREQDNSCGPNNLKIVNPDHPDVLALGSAEYMKLLVLAMHLLDVEEIVITAETIEECDRAEAVICIANMEDGIHLSLVTKEEAEQIAKDERGTVN